MPITCDGRQVALRRAEPRDAEVLCHIQRSAIFELGRLVYTEDEVRAWGDGLSPELYMDLGTRRYALVAELEACTVGFGALDCSSGEISAMYVLPKLARIGIGTILLDELLVEAARRGLSHVYCKASLFAQPFYEKAGFEAGPKQKHRFRDGREIDHVPMIKSLG